MAHINPTPADATAADPKRPYKAVAAFVLSFLTALYATLQGREDLDSTRLVDWLIVVLGAIVTAGATYAVTNPKAYQS